MNKKSLYLQQEHNIETLKPKTIICFAIFFGKSFIQLQD